MPDIRVVSDKENNSEKAVFGAIDSESPYRKKALSKRERPPSFWPTHGGNRWDHRFLLFHTFPCCAHSSYTLFAPGFVAESFHEDAKDAKV